MDRSIKQISSQYPARPDQVYTKNAWEHPLCNLSCVGLHSTYSNYSTLKWLLTFDGSISMTTRKECSCSSCSNLESSFISLWKLRIFIFSHGVVISKTLCFKSCFESFWTFETWNATCFVHCWGPDSAGICCGSIWQSKSIRYVYPPKKTWMSFNGQTSANSLEWCFWMFFKTMLCLWVTTG